MPIVQKGMTSIFEQVVTSMSTEGMSSMAKNSGMSIAQKGMTAIFKQVMTCIYVYGECDVNVEPGCDTNVYKGSVIYG